MTKEAPGILRPDLTVAAIVERDGRFLLVEERVQGRDVLNQPAGHVEPGENLVDAIRRETLEETAWTFEPEAVVGIYLWQRDPAANPFLRVAFAGRCLRHDPNRALDTGILRALWLNRDDLKARLDQLRSPMVLRGVEDYLEGVRYPLGLVQDLVQELAIEQLARRAARL